MRLARCAPINHKKIYKCLTDGKYIKYIPLLESLAFCKPFVNHLYKYKKINKAPVLFSVISCD